MKTSTQILIIVSICAMILALIVYIAVALWRMGSKARQSGTKIFSVNLLFSGLVFIVLIAYMASMFIALGWGLLTSFKSLSDFGKNYLFDLPERLEWSNYTQAIQWFKVPRETETGRVYVTFLGLLVNSVIYTIGGTLVGVFCPALVAYLVARFDFKFNKIVYTVVIVTMILPIVGTTHSAVQVYKFLGLYDSLWGILLGKASFLGAYFLIFQAAFKSIPNDYAEAAVLDGAGNTVIMLRIMFPFVKNMLMIVSVLIFIGLWNDYSVPLYFLPSKPNLALGLYFYNNSVENAVSMLPYKLVGCTIIFVPTLALFLIFKNKMIGNVTLGGIKG